MKDSAIQSQADVFIDYPSMNYNGTLLHVYSSPNIGIEKTLLLAAEIIDSQRDYYHSMPKLLLTSRLRNCGFTIMRSLINREPSRFPQTDSL